MRTSSGSPWPSSAFSSSLHRSWRPTRTGSQAVGHRERIGVAGKAGVVGQSRQLPEQAGGVGAGGEVDTEGEAGVGVEPGHDDEEAGADLQAAQGHRCPPATARAEQAGRLQLQLAHQRGTAPGQ